MKPVYAKTQDTRLAGLERQVRFLLRRSQTPEPDLYGPGGGGIQFDTYPQDGDWLYLNATDASGSPSGDGGIEINSGDGVYLSAGSFLDLQSSGNNGSFGTRIRSIGGALLLATDNNASVTALNFLADASSGNVHLKAINITIESLETSDIAGGISLTSGGKIQLTTDSTITFQAAQQAAITPADGTLAGATAAVNDVIALLQAYGLAS